MAEENLTYNQVLNLILEERENIKELRESQKQAMIQFDETKLIIQELALRFQETDKQIKKVSQEIGHLHNKFGAFNEALVLPSLEKLFAEQFKCKTISQRHQVLLNGNTFELDMLAVSEDACYIIEIKSKYRKDDLKQLLKHIEKYKINTPEHKNKKIFGVIVATDFNKENIKELAKKGVYFISVSDDIIKLHQPEGFNPFAW